MINRAERAESSLPPSQTCASGDRTLSRGRVTRGKLTFKGYTSDQAGQGCKLFNGKVLYSAVLRHQSSTIKREKCTFVTYLTNKAVIAFAVTVLQVFQPEGMRSRAMFLDWPWLRGDWIFLCANPQNTTKVVSSDLFELHFVFRMSAL